MLFRSLKVNGSKRDPKKGHLQDLIASFSDVGEICGGRCDYSSNTYLDVFGQNENKRDETTVKTTVKTSGNDRERDGMRVERMK